MLKTQVRIYLLLFFVGLEAIDNKVIISNITHARTKVEAYQEYRKAFKIAYDENKSKDYRLWLARLYKKTCADIDAKANDQSTVVMAKGLKRMFGL